MCQELHLSLEFGAGPKEGETSERDPANQCFDGCFEKVDRGGLAAGAGFILAVQQPALSLPGLCAVARSALGFWTTLGSPGSAGGAGVLQRQDHRALSVSGSSKV